MKVVLQRVIRASVTVHGETVGSIQQGYVLLCGILKGDTHEQVEWMAEKICKLRLWDGEDGKINDRSLLDTKGELLVVSQFTLAGKMEKGSRPDYTAAEAPERAEELYLSFADALRRQGVAKVETGTFRAHMEVTLINDGPVTLILER